MPITPACAPRIKGSRHTARQDDPGEVQKNPHPRTAHRAKKGDLMGTGHFFLPGNREIRRIIWPAAPRLLAISTAASPSRFLTAVCKEDSEVLLIFLFLPAPGFLKVDYSMSSFFRQSRISFQRVPPVDTDSGIIHEEERTRPDVAIERKFLLKELPEHFQTGIRADPYIEQGHIARSNLSCASADRMTITF